MLTSGYLISYCWNTAMPFSFALGCVSLSALMIIYIWLFFWTSNEFDADEGQGLGWLSRFLGSIAPSPVYIVMCSFFIVICHFLERECVLILWFFSVELQILRLLLFFLHITQCLRSKCSSKVPHLFWSLIFPKTIALGPTRIRAFPLRIGLAFPGLMPRLVTPGSLDSCPSLHLFYEVSQHKWVPKPVWLALDLYPAPFQTTWSLQNCLLVIL